MGYELPITHAYVSGIGLVGSHKEASVNKAVLQDGVTTFSS